MTQQQFTEAMTALKAHFEARSQLQAVLNIISPSSTGVVEYGGDFIDHYIKVVALALEPVANTIGIEGWLQWYVFDNQFGTKKLAARSRFGMEVKDICNDQDFYKLITE